MPKQVKANDHTVQDEKKRPPQESGDMSDHQNVQGKALQMNENSVGGRKRRAPALPVRGSSPPPNQQKSQGEALQVNENSVEDKGPGR
jgi:hypothetical protein